MAYDPGALEAALAAAVGEEPVLIAELRRAFLSSADIHRAALRQAATRTEWRDAASRLKSLGASFGALRVMEAAQAAIDGERGDAKVLRRIERALSLILDEAGPTNA